MFFLLSPLSPFALTLKKFAKADDKATSMAAPVDGSSGGGGGGDGVGVGGGEGGVGVVVGSSPKR